jgi:hypothetical protein
MTRFIRLSPYLILAGVFGPYVISGFGIRTEHVVVYPIAFALLACRHKAIIAAPPLLWSAFCLWSLILVIALTASFWENPFDADLVKVLAGIKDLTNPLAIMVIMAVYSDEMRRGSGNVEAEMARLFRFLLLLLSLNALIALFQTHPAVLPYVRAFWSSVETLDPGTATAAHANDQGRFTGIFGSPFEAGAAYSVGILAWVFMLMLNRDCLWDYVFLLGVVVGGIAPGSKVFWLGGLPLGLLGCLALGKMNSRVFFRRVSGVTMAAVLMLIAGSRVVDSIGPALEHFQWYVVDGDDTFVGRTTAGRFGADNDVSDLQEELLDSSPIIGWGFRQTLPLDTGYLHFVVISGVLGLSVYLLLLAILFLQGHVNLASCHIHGARFLHLLTFVFILTANFGASVLTANRASTVLWMFVWLLTLVAPWSHDRLCPNGVAHWTGRPRRKAMPVLSPSPLC